ACLFFFQAEDGIRDRNVTGVQTCALPISPDVAASITGKVSKKAYSRFTTSRKKLTGAISGSAILKKRRIGPAPSMAAASINEREIGRASCRERVESGGGEGRGKAERDACV